MSGPNPLLSEWYGTAPVEDPTMDKAAEFIKLATDHGIDVNSMTDEQILGLYTKVAQEAETGGEGGSQEIEDAAEQLADAIAGEAEQEASPEKEAELKLAEYDFAGRMMAHAHVDELNKIAEVEKEAAGGHRFGFLRSLATGRGASVGPRGGATKFTSRKEMLKALKAALGKRYAKGGGGLGGVKEMAKSPGLQQLLVAGGGLGAAGAGAGLGARALLKKKSEDEFVAAVIDRMQEKVAEYDDDSAVDAVADATLAKLAERGYFG